jgi:hypothetical protein
MLATGARAQPFNTETSYAPVTGDAAEPLGADQAAPEPDAALPPPPPPDKASFGVEWAEHVSPSFRRQVEGAPAPAPGDPMVRNQPGPVQRASDLGAVENALDKPAADEPDTGGVGPGAVFLKRVSRAHARYIAAPQGAVMGAELADGISMAPLPRGTRQRRADHRLPETGAPPRLEAGPLPGAGPLQEIPAEVRYDGAPLYAADTAPDPDDAPAPDGGTYPPPDGGTYIVAVATGEVVGAELADKVSVIHVSQFAKGERPDSGDFVVYPRGKFRHWGSIGAFEGVNAFQAINVEPLQSAEDPSDPSPAARSAYAYRTWDLPVNLPLPLADNSMIEARDRLIESQRHRHCCGPTRISVMNDPLTLFILPNSFSSMPGQMFVAVPLAPGMRVW